MEIWGSGINGILWDVGFGVGWPRNGYMGPGWVNMGHRDGWDPIRSGIWGRVAPKWRYGAQGCMGSYGIWDLGSGGPKMDIWDRDGRIWGTGIDGALWVLRYGVGWP